MAVETNNKKLETRCRLSALGSSVEKSLCTRINNHNNNTNNDSNDWMENTVGSSADNCLGSSSKIV
jgi:hypothetical protein